MNYQFFGTAGIITAILFVLFIIFLIAGDISEGTSCYYTTTTILFAIGYISLGIAVLFWFIVGIICGLNAVWGWGLVR